MTIRHLGLVASIALLPAAAVGCGEAPTPTTVRLVVRPTGHAAELIPGAEHGGAPLSTPMTQEVTTVPPWQGDADGVGEALVTVNLGQRELCWQTSVSQIRLPASASHIHRADPGVRGPIVLPLSPPDATGSASGCASDVDPELLKEILQNPAAFYVNVHNSDFPAGAVRGQLAK